MPPGLSRDHLKKRKLSSEDSDEQGATELNIANRQRRSAAINTHKVWEALKPGAAKMHPEEEMELETSASKKTRLTRSPKRKTTTNGDDKVEIAKGTQQLEDQKIDVVTQPKERIIIAKKATPFAGKKLHQRADETLQSSTNEPSDEDDEDVNFQPMGRVVLDDPTDVDFPDFPSRGGKRGRGAESMRGRGGRGRGGAVSTMPLLRGISSGIRGGRGRPRGSRGSMGGGVVRVRMEEDGGKAPMKFYPQLRTGMANGASSGIYSLQPTGGIVGDLPIKSTSVRVIRPRPAGIGLDQHGSMGGYRPPPIRPPPMVQYNEATFQINRELEKYRNSIVPESSVKSFNEKIEHLLQELLREREEREKIIATHRDFVEHLKLTHAASEEIKDNRIRQLERSLAELQHKALLSFKQEQLELVKSSSVPGAGAPNEVEEGQPKLKAEQQHHSGDQQQQGPEGERKTAEGEPIDIIGQPDTGSRMDGLRPATSAAVNIRQYPIGQQKMRIVMGAKGGGTQQQPPYLGLNINSPYDPYGDDEDMDDEEEDFDDFDEQDPDIGGEVII